MFSKIAVPSGAAQANAIALAPLTVVPAFQRLGIGSALVSAGLENCRSQREPRVFVYGDPVYYARFGFAAAARFGLKSASPEVEKYLLAIELEPRAFAGISGTIRYGHEFEDLE
jgi:predicted N-acetyltransferase YhbS